jgi:hypothetical protein
MFDEFTAGGGGGDAFGMVGAGGAGGDDATVPILKCVLGARPLRPLNSALNHPLSAVSEWIRMTSPALKVSSSASRPWKSTVAVACQYKGVSKNRKGRGREGKGMEGRRGETAK